MFVDIVIHNFFFNYRPKLFKKIYLLCFLCQNYTTLNEYGSNYKL